ncbi:MAG: thiamine phosphate synthase [Mycobacteriales bacterium]|jgi:thiamine-phosphate pyrophosphorylase
MLGADRRVRLAGARLYLCTGVRRREGDLDDFLDAVLAAGVDVVQLREKGLEARQEIAAAEIFAAAAARHGRLFAVNDRADVAYVARPDILHLGQNDLPVAAAREILGDEVLIGRSTHARGEVDAAAREPGVDYYCVGPTWPTPTKPGRPAPGLELTAYAASVGTVRPWFAIGGIDLGNLDDVLARGTTRVVVVRAISEAADPVAATLAFVERLRR